MKTYLNSADKQNITILAAAAQFLDQAIESVSKLPKPVVTNMKHGRTWTWKAVNETLESLDEKTRRQIVNIIKDTNIGVITKKDSQAWKKAADTYIGGQEYVHRMAEITMESKCRGCDGTCRDQCPLYESYVHFDVPTYDDGHPYCPYAHAGVTA